MDHRDCYSDQTVLIIGDEHDGPLNWKSSQWDL